MPGEPMLRAQVSFAAMWAGECAFMVALGVVAFRAGGVGAVGAVTAARMACAALIAPALATLADRVRREHVLVAVAAVRTVTLGGAAAATSAGAPAGVTYALAVVATVAVTMYRPAHSALLPALARSPQQLAGANAVRGMLDSSSTLGGPLLAAALLAASGPAAVFALCAAASLVSGLAVLALPYDAPPRAGDAEAPGRAALQGFAAIAGSPGLALITGLGLVQTFTRGCLTVFTVVVAIVLLDSGNAGVGVLNASIGAGGLLGSVAAFRLVRGGRLAGWFGLGIALFGAPLALLGVLPDRVSAVVLLGVVGVGNALIDVGGFTLLARLADETVLARMFAGFEAILTLGFAAGGLVAPVLVHALGVRTALGVVGALAPVAVLCCWPALRRLDATMGVRDADIAVLRGVGTFGVLPATTIEQLAARLERERFPSGQAVFAQGEPGDRFYVIDAGRAEVVQDGRLIRTLTRGEGFGEIALLDDTPRTATVRAAPGAPLEVVAIGRRAYLTAVTGYPASATAGTAVAEELKARDAERRLGAGAAR